MLYQKYIVKEMNVCRGYVIVSVGESKSTVKSAEFGHWVDQKLTNVFVHFLLCRTFTPTPTYTFTPTPYRTLKTDDSTAKCHWRSETNSFTMKQHLVCRVPVP